MDNMLDMYLFETNTLLEQLDGILLNAEKSKHFTVDDVNEIFRTMHTIKGSSAMMEFTSLMKIAHKIEDLFFLIRDNGVDKFDEVCSEEEHHELFDLIFNSIDFIRSEIEKIENNETLTDNIDIHLEKINNFVNKIKVHFSGEDEETNTAAVSGEQAVGEESHSEENLPDNSPYFLRVFFDEGCGMEHLRAFMLITALSDVINGFTYYPESVESNPQSAQEIIDHGFYIGLKDKEMADKAVCSIKSQSNIQTYEVIENSAAKVEKPAPSETKTETKAPSEKPKAAESAPAPAAKKSTSAQPTAQAKQSLISVNLTKLDKLMAIVGEIVITEAMVTSCPDLANLKLDNFTKSARQLRKLTDELQDIAMSIRMVPISGVFQKMNRIVRDMNQKLNKNVELVLIGEDTEVDKTIVDGIGDPIMHIVRNSMDHGIEETIAEREAAGKPAKGTIILKAEHTGSEVIVSVEDDGQGVNPDSILAKAQRNGLLTKPESEYSQREILNLLMMPGFSTNEQVTEFSGRGVGMDVVKKNVENVGGIVTITSTIGKGMCTTLKIPLTMAIVDGMEISVGKSVFTIPINNICQSIKATSDQIIHNVDNSEVIKIMDEFYPLFRLHEIYNLETDITNIEDGIIIWVEAGDKSYCLFVDELLGEQQVVVKPIPAYLNSFDIKNSGIAGCTILGDGNISIILDVANLYAKAHSFA
ncbi:MAG: chemotaxis protein CheA [Firmicutes bacterium]|nr:chemotaxis protein CheA [Bacillota bacterium]